MKTKKNTVTYRLYIQFLINFIIHTVTTFITQYLYYIQYVPQVTKNNNFNIVSITATVGTDIQLKLWSD